MAEGEVLTAGEMESYRKCAREWTGKDRAVNMGLAGQSIERLLASHDALADALRAVAGAAHEYRREVDRYENTSVWQRLEMSEGEKSGWQERRHKTQDALLAALALPAVKAALEGGE